MHVRGRRCALPPNPLQPFFEALPLLQALQSMYIHSIKENNSGHHEVLRLPRKMTLMILVSHETSSAMRGATRVTLQHHEVLCLPRKKDSHHGSLSRTIRPEQRRPYSHHLGAVLFGILHWSEAKPVARIASKTWKIPQARMEKVKPEKNCQKKRKKIANLD